MNVKSDVFNCNILKLQVEDSDHHKSINIICDRNLPFNVKRVYYLYNVPGGARGSHAHKELKQLIVSACGSFDVILNDGENQKTVHLNHPDRGLLIEPGIWREIVNFSYGAVCLVLASLEYDENDYIRDYNDFLNYRKNDT